MTNLQEWGWVRTAGPWAAYQADIAARSNETARVDWEQQQFEYWTKQADEEYIDMRNCIEMHTTQSAITSFWYLGLEIQVGNLPRPIRLYTTLY